MSSNSGQSKKYIKPDKKHASVKAGAVAIPKESYLEKKPWIYMILLFLLLSILYFPVAYEHKAPPASDTMQWSGAAHRLIEYNKTHTDKALWQPNMFSGMPSYMISFPFKYPFLENITRLFDYVVNWRIFLLFIGGLGMFFLLRLLGLDGFSSFFGAVAFVFISHWTGLLDIGHNTKFRAMMWVPWVVWAVMWLRKKPNLLGLGFTSVFLITQLRENHPQISYYLYLFIGMYWIYSLIETFGNKEWKKFVIFTLLMIVAFGFMGLAVMNTNLSTMEYSKYTIRGGEKGLDTSYAQGWSFHPLEIVSFLIPDFFGGINQTYWGWMEFTQIYNYFGILILALALLALAGRRKKFAGFLWISSLLFLIMSFGRHWSWFSNILLNYLPYFNKFRVPSMLLVITQFNMAVLAAIGLGTVIEKAKEEDKVFDRQFKTWFIVSVIILGLFLVLGKGVFKGLPFTTANEIAQLKQNNQYDQLPALKAMRLDMLYKSGAMSFLFLAGGFGLIFMFIRKKIPKTVFLVLILLITFIDVWIYTGKNLKNIESAKDTQQNFDKRDYDEFLLSDKENYRIYPLNVGMNGKWAYYHQTIQGYHGAKLKRYQEVLENSLDAQLRQNKINWNLLNMLDVKYVVFPDTLPFPNLTPVFSSNDDQIVVHRNQTALPRAWVVEKVKTIKEPKFIWSELNSDSFNPAQTAIVEEPMEVIPNPTVKIVKPTSFDLHNLSFETETDTKAFVVVSEIYYPAGWKAYIDGKETKIYPTDYILRGVIVPAGKHKLEMKFDPASYKLSILLSGIGIIASLLALLIGLALWYRNRKKPIETDTLSKA